MLGDVAYYRDEDDPDEELGDPVLLGQGFYGPDESLRDVGDGEAVLPNGASPSRSAPPSGLRRM